MNAIELIIANFSIWENRNEYIKILENFLLEDPLNDKINRENLNIKIRRLYQKNENKYHTWEQVGLKVPEDNEEIIKQATFSSILTCLARKSDNDFQSKTIEEANKKFRNNLQNDLSKLKSLL